MQLEGKLVRAARLSGEEQDAMFSLMDGHYTGVNRAAFHADLAEKEWVIQILDPRTGRLCGFSTQMLVRAEGSGRRVLALFSGDTIIARDRWGDAALFHVWGRLALTLVDAYPDEDLYWFLISQGYKTYRLLPLFFHEYYPRHDRPLPEPIKALIDALATARYPAAYDARNGVIRANPHQYRLRAGLAEVTPERLRDPHVRFFDARNPGHVRGDELCCLAPLTRANFTPAAYRVIGPEPAAVGVP
jgi:hypothetical protein